MSLGAPLGFAKNSVDPIVASIFSDRFPFEHTNNAVLSEDGIAMRDFDEFRKWKKMPERL
jgi:hypothetical protein